MRFNVFIYLYAWLLVEALRLRGRLAEHHRAPQHRAHVARVASINPAPVPEPEDADKPLEPKTPAAPAPQEETTPLQDYATYEATKDISDPNTAAAAGAAAAQVAGALQ